MNCQENERARAINPELSNKAASQLIETESRSTVADLLVEAHPGCSFHARQSVKRFRRSAVRKYGMWFDFVLAAHPEDVSSEDALYLSLTWEQWVACEDPFGLRRRRVST